MTLLRAECSLLLLTAVGLACRDAASSPTRPNFAVTSDTTPGGCTSRVCQFNASGDAAFVNWSGPSGVAATDTGGGGGGGSVSGSLSVSRGGSSAETFLFYNIVACGPFGCSSVAGGFGTIPNEDFSANGANYRLNTNTDGNAAFFTFAGAPGQVTVQWSGDGVFESRFTGTTQTTSPGVQERSSGQSTSKSATATGSVVGFDIFAVSFGQISSDHQMRITINR